MPAGEGRPPCRAPDSIKYALRDSQGRLLAGDAQLPAVPMTSETSQLLAMAQLDQRSVRTLTTRFDTRAGVIIITTADVRPGIEPAARYGFMSTLLWDFVQLDITLVLVWVGIQLGLRPIRRLRNEIAERSPLDLRPISGILGAPRNRSRGRHPESIVRHAAHRRAIAAAVHRQHRASIAHADHGHAGSAGSPGRGTGRAADQRPPADAARRHTATGACRQSIAHAGAGRPRRQPSRQESDGGSGCHRRRGRGQILRPRAASEHRLGSRGAAGIASTRTPRCSTIC